MVVGLGRIRPRDFFWNTLLALRCGNAFSGSTTDPHRRHRQARSVGAVELDDPRVPTVPKLDETEYGRVSTVARAPVTPSTLRGMNTGNVLPEQQVLVGFLADPNGFNWASTLPPP